VTSNRWRSPFPLNIAHQGGENELPGNTLYAFKEAQKAGVDMLKLDVSVSKDDQLVLFHDPLLDFRTESTGAVNSYTLEELRRLDNAYWFSHAQPGHQHFYSRDKSPENYILRGVATGQQEPPEGYLPADFGICTLAEVLASFPDMPLVLDIKARSEQGLEEEYFASARLLAQELAEAPHGQIIVSSFNQPTVDLLHSLMPDLALAPGPDGIVAFLTAVSATPGDGVAAISAPITWDLNGTVIEVACSQFVDQTHDAGYAWYAWFDDRDPDNPIGWQKLVQLGVDAIVTSSPIALASFLNGLKGDL